MRQNRPHTFLGLHISQNSYALRAMNRLFLHMQPARIIELGTFQGGFTIFLGVYCRQVGIPLVTYDSKDKRTDPGLMAFLDIDFRCANVFKCEEEIAGLIQQKGTTILLCDNGNKPLEVQTFAPYLKPGDVICAHDYSPSAEERCPMWAPAIEIQDSDLEGVEDLKPLFDANMRKASWLCRVKS